jgi:hypothetical protein
MGVAHPFVEEHDAFWAAVGGFLAGGRTSRCEIMYGLMEVYIPDGGISLKCSYDLTTINHAEHECGRSKHMNNEPMKTNEERSREEHTWTEQIEIAGSELVERTKELIEEGNVRRLIIRNHDDEILLEVPLTAGVAVGGVLTVVAPVLAALGAMAALLAWVKVEIVRTRGGGGEE